MKKAFLFCLLLVLILGSCTKQKCSKIEGAWQYVSGAYTNNDTLTSIPGDWAGTDMKIWSGNRFIFVGVFEKDTVSMDSYGGGTFELKGTQYEETILYHTKKSSVGKIVKMTLEIRNDTLIQSYPLNDQGKLDSANFSVEKYVRFK